MFPTGEWNVKDLEVLDDRVAEGRFTAELVDRIRRTGDDIARALEAGDHWWDPKWADWQPDPSWRNPRLPDGWA